MKDPGKQGAVIQVHPQPPSYIIKEKDLLIEGIDFTFNKVTLERRIQDGQEPVAHPEVGHGGYSWGIKAVRDIALSNDQ
ncbi:hypothetical protein NPIL_425301 [Nephila pilipes]|uniref:Uncharacterized protein n=1 Tax=Nephila pilipes TaxID=299642 RepID=A0A8X6QCD1_NEPPI|nr:hypothetical protein NPIL_425301 [Nephila pilipes]